MSVVVSATSPPHRSAAVQIASPPGARVVAVDVADEKLKRARAEGTKGRADSLHAPFDQAGPGLKPGAYR
jgi:NADPH-dependent curcumin reductase CurA